MMSINRKLEGPLKRWLRHESAGADGEAEAALGELLRALPATRVPAGFASRVLAASGLRFGQSRQPKQRARWFRMPGWAWQTAFAAWLVSGFLAAIGFTGFAVDLARSGQAVELGTRLVVALSRLGADALAVLGVLLRAGAAISTAFSGPAVLAVVMICALASLTTLGALKPLLTSERSRHVESY